MLNLNKISFITLGKKQIFPFLFIAFSYTIFAQNSFYENSDLFYKKVEELVSLSKFDNALKIIDTLSQKNTFFCCESKNYFKEYVYSIKFNKSKNQNDYDSCFYYFSKSLSSAKEINNYIIPQLKYFSSLNHNKAADAIMAQKIDSAEFYYSQSRKALLLVDSSVVYKRDIEFYLACASTCMIIYENEVEINKAYFEKGIDYYKKILLSDSNSYAANYSTMIAYYNTAVTELRKADYCKQIDIANSVDWSNPNQEIPSIEKLLECIKPEEFEKYNFTPALKKALPFALKAYKMKPSNKHVVEALTGIYYAMNDKKALSKYRNELKKLK